MRVFLYIFTLQFLSISQAFSCIWTRAETPYWPSTTIPVCFLNQNPTANEKIDEAKEIVRRAYKDLSDSTRFNFEGFTQCDLTPPLKPAMRIEVNGNIGVGSAVSIGPESSNLDKNLTLGYNINNLDLSNRGTDQTGSNINPLTLSEEEELFATTQHEVLHLLGFRHECERGTKACRQIVSTPNTTVDPQFDSNSIMAYNNSIKRVSTRDIQCLNDLAIRTVRASARTQPLLQRSHSTPVRIE